MTNEVVANAIIHARSPVALRVSRDDACARVDVHDHSNDTPTRQPPNRNQPGGNGLAILDAFAANWGVTATATPGKIVWFEFPITT